MQRIAQLIIIAVILVSLTLAQSGNVQSILIQSALAQESGESVPEAAAQDELDPQPEDEEAEAEAEAEEEEPDEEGAVVDDEFYQDADDEDFVPSENIPADQSIAFPTDI
jgi:hypothetical protein